MMDLFLKLGVAGQPLVTILLCYKLLEDGKKWLSKTNIELTTRLDHHISLSSRVSTLLIGHEFQFCDPALARLEIEYVFSTSQYKSAGNYV